MSKTEQMTMEEVFSKLRSLQEILSEKFEIEREMEEIPKILATRTELLNRMKKSYLEKTQEYETKGRIKKNCATRHWKQKGCGRASSSRWT